VMVSAVTSIGASLLKRSPVGSWAQARPHRARTARSRAMVKDFLKDIVAFA